MHHGLSFDVEDWHQLIAMRIDRVPSDPSPTVDDCIARMLDVCDELDVKATFFVLGLLARKRPHVVKQIAERGHEIASHSLGHQLLHTMTAQALADDLRGSKALLEDLSGKSVVGFRAPEFSVQRLDHPCFEAIRRAGFTYDSSVFPIPGLRYGIANAPHEPFRISTDAGELVELPLATTSFGRWRFPIAGGSHFRLLPTRLVTWAAARAEHAQVFYFHPYEFTRRWLYLAGGLARNRPIVKHVILHNLATRRVERSLRALGKTVSFVPLRELANAVASPGI